jgi:arylsulfatase A-like enzyme
MLPAFEGDDIGPRVEPLYWEYHGLWGGAQAVRLGDWKGVRLGGHEDVDAPIELYDLGTDPFETTDVSADQPDVVERVRAVMESRTPARLSWWNFAFDGYAPR